MPARCPRPPGLSQHRHVSTRHLVTSTHRMGRTAEARMYAIRLCPQGTLTDACFRQGLQPVPAVIISSGVMPVRREIGHRASNNPGMHKHKSRQARMEQFPGSPQSDPPPQLSGMRPILYKSGQICYPASMQAMTLPYHSNGTATHVAYDMREESTTGLAGLEQSQNLCHEDMYGHPMKHCQVHRRGHKRSHTHTCASVEGTKRSAHGILHAVVVLNRGYDA